MAKTTTKTTPTTPPQTKPPVTSAPAGGGDDDKSMLGTLLTWLAFVTTLAVVVARAMMSETVREPFDLVVQGSAAPRGPGASTTLILNALCCLPALLVLARRAIDREYLVRGSWSHVLLGLLALWAAVSFAWSTDRFVTAISAANTIAAAALVWSTTQLVRSWLRLRIVAGVCLGLLLVYGANGLYYRYVQVPDNARFWQENRQQILQERQLEPDSFAAKSLERKFVGGEMIGFNQSPNSFAAVIVLLMVVSTGVALARRGAGDPPGWWPAIALACLPALLVLYLTRSRTSAGTLLIAASLLASLATPRMREWLATHARLAYAIGAAVVLLSAVALVGHGAYHGSLPNDSLNFRWRYWVAASKLVAQHPLTGVGWGNFGPHYLAVRVPAAAEEIRDPHNFVVRGFAELGIVGGLLVVAWLARLAWELTRPVLPPAPRDGPPSGPGGITTLATIALAGIALNLICAVDFSQPAAYVQLEVFYRVLYLGLLAGGLLLAAIRPGARARLDDRPTPWLLYATIVAIAVFLVHAMMDFVLAEPGALALFAVLAGAALGLRMPSAAGARRRRGVAIAALALGAAAWVLAVVAVVIPVADAEQVATRADAKVRERDPATASAMLDAAFRTLPYNADYPARSARALMLAGAPPEKVRAMLDIAIATDPANVELLQTRAAYELRQPSPDAGAVRGDYEKILRLDLNNVPARLDFAAALEKFNDPAAAAAHYREALRLNDLLDKTEPERLTAERVDEIGRKVTHLQPARAPTTNN